MPGLDLTFETLIAADNNTVETVLRAGLEVRDRVVAEGALRAVLRCKPPKLLFELVQRWDNLSDRWRTQIAQYSSVMAPAIREAFLSQQEPLVRNAIAAASFLGVTELISFFCSVVEDKRNPYRRQAAEAVVNIAEKLHEELLAPRDYQSRRDPQRIRGYVVSALEVSAARFVEHRMSDILEAFLLLTPHDNATLRQLLQDGTHPAHRPLCEQLLRSTRPGIAQLLFTSLESANSPVMILRLIAQRRDVGFFRLLCRKLAEEGHPQIDANLARIESFPWIKENVSCVNSLSALEQRGVVRLVAKSHAVESQVEKLLHHLLQRGEPLGRQAALRALVERRPANIVQILQDQVEYGIPLVRAEAVRHLRACDVPHALPKLIELLKCSEELVRDAARASLEEFSFARYLAAYEQMNAEARQATGALVKRVNPHLVTDLQQELESSGRARRLRALEIAALLEVVPRLEANLIDLARCEDYAVQMEAIRLLGFCATESAHNVLKQLALVDDHTVQSAALHALQEQSASPVIGFPVVPEWAANSTTSAGL